MTLERSAEGQASQALFRDAQISIYVEGGGGSLDQAYWQKVLEHFLPGIRFAFLPRGGKTALLELAKQIVDKNIRNVAVALDADYDFLFARTVDDPRVLYTYGYSWENDVWNAACAAAVIAALCPVGRGRADPSREIEVATDACLRALKRGIVADVLASTFACSVLPRGGQAARVFAPWNPTKLPKVSKRQIATLTRGAQAKRPPGHVARLPTAADIEPARHCVGHIFAELHFRVVAHLVFRHTTKSPQKDVVAAIGLDKLLIGLSAQREMRQYFRSQVDRFARHLRDARN